MAEGPLSDGVALEIERSTIDGLLAMLGRLDRRLKPMVMAMQAASPEAAGDPYRGLYVTQAEVEQLLEHAPGEPPFQRNGSPGCQPDRDTSSSAPRLAWLETYL